MLGPFYQNRKVPIMKRLVIFFVSAFFGISAFSFSPLLEVQDESSKMFAVISAEGTDSDAVKGLSLVPRGSAVMTPSGALAASGIKYVIHAAPGTMGSVGPVGEPTLSSIRLSIANSIRVAERKSVKSIAIPLVGGGIFLERLGLSQEQLAFEIINAARLTKTKMKVVFVGYESEEFAKIDAAYLKNKSQNAEREVNALIRFWRWVTSWIISRDNSAALFFANSSVVHGSITKFSDHHAEAIVNAANMELEFGGGLSGVIGRATQQAEAIDAVNQKLIQSLKARFQ